MSAWQPIVMSELVGAGVASPILFRRMPITIPADAYVRVTATPSEQFSDLYGLLSRWYPDEQRMIALQPRQIVNLRNHADAVGKAFLPKLGVMPPLGVIEPPAGVELYGDVTVTLRTNGIERFVKGGGTVTITDSEPLMAGVPHWLNWKARATDMQFTPRSPSAIRAQRFVLAGRVATAAGIAFMAVDGAYTLFSSDHRGLVVRTAEYVGLDSKLVGAEMMAVTSLTPVGAGLNALSAGVFLSLDSLHDKADQDLTSAADYAQHGYGLEEHKFRSSEWKRSLMVPGQGMVEEKWIDNKSPSCS